MIKMIENVINESQVRHTNSVELVLVVFVGKQCSFLGIMATGVENDKPRFGNFTCQCIRHMICSGIRWCTVGDAVGVHSHTMTSEIGVDRLLFSYDRTLLVPCVNRNLAGPTGPIFSFPGSVNRLEIKPRGNPTLSEAVRLSRLVNPQAHS
jgi:hypothetical protein